MKNNNNIVFHPKRRLGKTGIEVSPLCYGCAGAWGRSLITDDEARDLMELAYSLGISFFDTGHSYGMAEERIGKALSSSSVLKRKNIVISTKFGTRIKDGKLIHDTSPDWIRESAETSLERMKTDYIDLLYIHGPQLPDLNESLFYTLDDLKSQGIIKAAGANTFDTHVIQHISNTKCLDVVMLDYNIVRQDREPLIKELYDRGIGIVAGQAMAEGVFLKDLYRLRSLRDLWYLARTFGRKPSRELFLSGRKFRFLNKSKNPTASQIALKFVTDNPYISSASVGTCTPSHLRSNINALDIRIPADIYKRIKNTQA